MNFAFEYKAKYENLYQIEFVLTCFLSYARYKLNYTLIDNLSIWFIRKLIIQKLKMK